jgi:uncharacterized protein
MNLRIELGQVVLTVRWTEGDALALPFGRTPISTDERPKLASRCNVVGRIEGDAQALKKVRAGERISVSSA